MAFGKQFFSSTLEEESSSMIHYLRHLRFVYCHLHVADPIIPSGPSGVHMYVGAMLSNPWTQPSGYNNEQMGICIFRYSTRMPRGKE